MNAIESARDEFARQAREVVALSRRMSETEALAALEEAIGHFSQARYAFVSEDALAVLRQARLDLLRGAR